MVHRKVLDGTSYRIVTVTRLADVRKGSRLCENVDEPRMRRIVFSIAFSRKRLPVQLIFTSTKSRQNFYAQIQLQSFHTA